MKKNRLLYIIISILLVAVVGLAVTLIALKNKNDEGKEKLIIVTEALYEPWEFYENGEIIGIDIDIAKEIANRMGKTLEILDVDFRNVFNELNNNNAHLCIAGLTITPERSEQVDFSIPYHTTKAVIVVKTNSSYQDLDDLNGKTIAVQPATAVENYLISKYGEQNLTYRNSTPEAVQEVISGNAEAVAMPYENALVLIQENNDLRILDEELYRSDYAIAVKKGNSEMLQIVNKILEDLIAEGKIAEYLDKYSA